MLYTVYVVTQGHINIIISLNRKKICNYYDYSTNYYKMILNYNTNPNSKP